MKLPHLFTDEHSAHFLLLLLTVTNSLLIVIIFFIALPERNFLIPKIVPVSAQTPIIDFNLISPKAGSQVSGTVPLVTTLSNGPKITSAQLKVDGNIVQTLFSQKTDRLTIFWNTTDISDGKHTIVLSVGQDNNHTSTLTTTLIVQNNVAR